MNDRTQSIGGSDAGAVLGVNPWRTPYELYLEKIGELPPTADNNSTYWGQVLEDVVATEYARRQNVSVRRANQIRVHPKYSWMTVHLDRLIQGGKRQLECKTANAYRTEEWGEEGSDEVPQVYLAQAQHGLAVTGRAVVDLAVLIGGQDFRIYEIQRDEELIAYMIEIEAAFWARVQRRDPPPPVSLADAKRAWPRDSGKAIRATAEIEEAVEKLKRYKRDGELCEQYQDELELVLKSYMGEHDTLLSTDDKALVTWRTAKASRHFDGERFAREQPELYKEYLVERQGSRRFLPK